MNRQVPRDDGAPAPTDEWGVDRLDVSAYRSRIGDDDELAPTLAALHRLHRRHVAAIPFENLDVVLGRGVDLGMEGLQRKLVRQLRGGYCFEHNLLFAALLERVGFPVTRLAARVQMGSTALRPRTHMLLRVEVEGVPWLADVGFGGEGILEPIRLVDGEEAQQGQWRFRLDRVDGDTWMLRSQHPDGWFDLYRFGLEPQHHVDYVLHNHYTATHPSSPFVHQVVVQQTSPDVRRTLRDRVLTETWPDGSVTERTIDDEERGRLLRDTFGIVLDEEAAALLTDRAA